MDLELIELVANELDGELSGKQLHKIFRTGDFDVVLLFEDARSRLLFISAEPSLPRAHLVRRKLREIKRAALNTSRFEVELLKALGNRTVRSVARASDDRIIEITAGSNALVIQLTGRSANVFVLDAERRIMSSLRWFDTEGQRIGGAYRPPQASPRFSDDRAAVTERLPSVSEAIDRYYSTLLEKRDFDSLAKQARGKVKREKARFEKLVVNFGNDLAAHGDPKQWKRFGDLILANVATAKRDGEKLMVTDFFDPEQPTIEIKVDANESVTEAAERCFERYAKARNAQAEIKKRIDEARKKIGDADTRAAAIEVAIAERDREKLISFIGNEPTGAPRKGTKPQPKLSGVRVFVSSDGFEILVGKKATDNDYLTFRVAASRDTWMHAADYPGSHVVIRNPTRKEIPQRTLLDAAQLAAFYSQGKKQTKAAVHFTEKKFVNKIKGAAPGLVRLASFKTLLVEPKFPAVKKKDD